MKLARGKWKGPLNPGWRRLRGQPDQSRMTGDRLSGENWPVVRLEARAEKALHLVRNRDVWLILAGLAITTYLHYSTNQALQTIHTVYRSLYYLPLLYAALRFGLRGGLTVALVSGLAYIPYVFIFAGSRPADVVEDLLETLIYVSVGVLTGLLVDAGRRQRARQRELEAQVRRAERLSTLGTLAGGLAHEVRNPLAGIRASAQMLAEESDDPEAGEYLSVIQNEADRLDRLIETLLDYARPEHVEVGPVGLNQVLADVAYLTQSYAAQTGVEMEINPSPAGLLIQGERDRLHQCLLNLALNAIQAMPGGGGLGLAIVQRIVADHGGQVEVESSLGQGSIFRVWLPLTTDSDRRQR